MTPPITPEAARDLVRNALLKAIPDGELDRLDDREDFRDALELDSLDFLTFVEHLSNTSGIRIDDEDYDRLTTIQSSVDYLTSRG
ncbi:acyl carrier protein [Saccharopolyspora elongata]|uniref:Acyl carrier protein n=1 Tax=Saccharopolyspora elongata TaxID=2530387 RepID=A0A4R4Y923_9PSEU|nr:phosphopantetheine-binding protein [Saccharopolyspora elongata]TDD40876.1 acyl carrier protein [Saccharopolyspora elongata]